MRSSVFLALGAATLALGCANSARSTESWRGHYAQTTCMDSETCCLLRNPGNPEACGLSASEAAIFMGGARAATDSATAAWDDSHNADLPDWKRQCIRSYGDCKDFGWSGSCYDCLRLCEGQQDWPLHLCRPPKKGKR
ncbi:hypothetical protein ACLESD_03350 [Pyxidicoccus sp. 3LFB2]